MLVQAIRDSVVRAVILIVIGLSKVYLDMPPRQEFAAALLQLGYWFSPDCAQRAGATQGFALAALRKAGISPPPWTAKLVPLT